MSVEAQKIIEISFLSLANWIFGRSKKWIVTCWSCSKKLTSTTQAKTANKKLNDANEEIPLYVPQKDVIAPIVASKCLK